MELKEIRGRICNAIYSYAKANNKYIKHYDKNKESSYLNAVFENTMEHVKTYRYQACSKRTKKELFTVRTKLSYTKFFSGKLLAIQMNKKTQVLISKNLSWSVNIRNN